MRDATLKGAELLSLAMNDEDDRLLRDDYDDCEGHELCSSPPSRSCSPAPDGKPISSPPGSIHKPRPTNTSSHLTVEQRRKADYSRRKKQKKRVSAAQSPFEGRSYKTRSHTINRLESVARTSVKFNAKSLKAAGSGAFVGQRARAVQSSKPPTPAQLRRRGFLEVEWTGRYNVWSLFNLNI